ncbi:MAG: acyl-CoA thioesterase [Bacteroidales bacterium]|nr:acyl-CoA thioesterase [Bacteroidales bacterium]MCL2133764.1 acyl-CoA thioesterase [Bacteroidales bacterium]
MLSYEMTHRVAYYETDVMGYVHHSNYVRYFEIARTEMMRAAGFTYAELEASGVMMPIIEVHSRYYQPAKYDDLLTFRATVKELQGVRLTIEYEVLNEIGTLLCSGSTTLAFIDAATRRPCRAPEDFVSRILGVVTPTITISKTTFMQ